MNPPALPAAASPVPVASRRSAAPTLHRRRIWLWVLLILAAFVAAGIAWAILRAPDTRPLNAQQLADFDAKIARVQQAGALPQAPVPVEPAPAAVPGTLETADQRQDEAAPYQPGARRIVFTEREINHLLRERFQLGDTVRVALRDGRIAIYADIPIEEGAPLLGGHTLRARSQIFAGEEDGQPVLRLDDLTLWGISLPNAWLGELKGRNLLAEAAAGSPAAEKTGLARGIRHLSIESGRIQIDLAD